MTLADDLRKAVDAEDVVAIRQLLAPLDEPRRADLVPLAKEVVREVVPKGLHGYLGPMLLLAYGTLSVTEIRKLGWRSNHVRDDLIDVLRGRAPDRLGPIADYLLEHVRGPRPWRTVRQLVREGIIPRPTSPAYAIGMIRATAYRPATDLLAADPGLLDVEVWRLFEVEGGGEDSLANHEKFFGDSWGTAFRSMAAADPAMRERLLDASLAALARDFAQYRAGWFSRFHESLEPTDEERAQRAEAYLGLLRSRVGPTVSFAVTALGRIDRAGLLPGSQLLDVVGPVLSDAAAGTARTGLDLVTRAALRSPGDQSRAGVVAAEALRHPSVDVQRAAIGAIEKIIPGPDPAVAAALAERLSDVAGSQRAAGAALLERLGGKAPIEAAPAEPDVRTSAVVTSPTDPSRALQALPTLESLVDVAVSVLETGEPADDLERVLDGVRRFADRDAEGFARLVAPIAKRAGTLLGRRDSMPFNGFDPRADAAAMLLAWTTGEVVAAAGIHPTVGISAGAFLSARARDAAEDVARGHPKPTVALPTHRGGWIDPRVLVDRLAAGPPASSLDLIAAVLRLAPDGRREALSAAVSLRGEAGAVVRYALGGEESIGPTTAWWVAAARVRSPGADDDGVDRRHPNLGPEAARAARFRLQIVKPKGTYEELRLNIEPRPVEGTPPDMPTALMVRNPSIFAWTGRSDPAMYRWMATIQPGYREPWAAAGSLLMGRNIDWWSAEWGNRAFLEPFLDPWSTVGPHAMTLLGIALGAKEAGERGLATDVTRLAISDGRLDAAALARALAGTTDVHLDRPGRWALSLADVAAESDRHAGVVAEAIGRTLVSLAARPPASLVALLRLLDELLALNAATVVNEAHPALEAMSGSSGQAGRLARSILARGQRPIG